MCMITLQYRISRPLVQRDLINRYNSSDIIHLFSLLHLGRIWIWNIIHFYIVFIISVFTYYLVIINYITGAGTSYNIIYFCFIKKLLVSHCSFIFFVITFIKVVFDHKILRSPRPKFVCNNHSFFFGLIMCILWCVFIMCSNREWSIITWRHRYIYIDDIFVILTNDFS